MGTIETLASERRSSAFRAVLSSAALAARLAGLLSAVLLRMEIMLEKRRSRRILLELTDEQLKDIGISRADASREAARPFWD